MVKIIFTYIISYFLFSFYFFKKKFSKTSYRSESRFADWGGIIASAYNYIKPAVEQTVKQLYQHYSNPYAVGYSVASSLKSDINKNIKSYVSSSMAYRTKRTRYASSRPSRRRTIRRKGGYRSKRTSRRTTRFRGRRGGYRGRSRYGRRGGRSRLTRKSNFIGQSKFARRIRAKEYRHRLKHVPPVQCNESVDIYANEIHTPAPSTTATSYTAVYYGFPGGGNTCGIKTIARIRGLDHIYQLLEQYYVNLTDKSIVQFYEMSTHINMKNPSPDTPVKVEMFLCKHRPGNMDTELYGGGTYTIAPWSQNTGTGKGDIMIPGGLPESALVSGCISNDMDQYSSSGYGGGAAVAAALLAQHSTSSTACIYEAWAPGADLFKVPSFVNYWNVISSKTFFLGPRKNKSFTWKIPDFEMPVEELYNANQIGAANRALYAHKNEIFVMLRITGELGVEAVSNIAENVGNAVTVSRGNAIVLYEVTHKSKHNIAVGESAPQYFPNIYGTYLNASGVYSTATTNSYPITNTKISFPMNSTHYVTQAQPVVGQPPIPMANVFNGTQSTSLFPGTNGAQRAQMFATS